MAFHSFAKNQLIAIDKLINGKAIRTVTAEDRITAICYNVLAGERNKRPPPARALVLPSFRRTEGGMAPVIAALSAQPFFYVGDGTAFDSTASSQLVIEGPVRLWERGVEGSWGAYATTSFIRSYYESLADGIIIDLLDGSEVRKTGGGGTGSAPTSVDNRDWVRIAFRAAWSVATGLPCCDFRDHVVFANASDDVAFSVDELTHQKIPAIRLAMKDLYGVDFAFELRADHADILHLVVPTTVDEAMYKEIGIPVPTTPLRHSESRLATMRSEYRADRMRFHPLVACDHIATRSIGHIYLTAHDPAYYSDIAHTWADSVSGFLLFYFKEIGFEIARDAAGLVRASTVVFGTSQPSKRLINLARNHHPARQADYIASQQKWARKWLRSHRLPSYLEVFKLWVSPSPPMEERAIARRYAHLPLPKVITPALDIIRNGLIRADELVAFVPRSLAKIGGEPDVYQFQAPFTRSEFIVERFIWAHFLEKEKRCPTLQELSLLCKQSPFGATVDPKAFMALVVSEAGTGLRDLSTLPLDAIASSMLCALFLYTMSDILLMRLARTRFIGTFILVCFFIVTRIDTLYSLISLAFWIGEGTMSLTISNLVVKDPYLILKMFSLLVVQSLGIASWGCFPGMWWFSRQFSWPAKILTLMAQARLAVPNAMQHRLGRRLPDHHWLPEVDRVLHSFDFQRWLLVSAGTGSGKSSMFVASLLEAPGVRRVFLLLPNNVLVQDYDNAFLDVAYVTKVYKGDNRDDFPKTGVVVLTYGHFVQLFRTYSLGSALSHYSEALTFKRSDVTCFDEAGSFSLEMGAAFILCHEYRDGQYNSRMPGVAMTATPDGPLCELLASNRVDKAGIIRHSSRTTYVTSDQLGLGPHDYGLQANYFARLVDHAIVTDPREFARSLLVYPSIPEVEKMARSLVSSALPAEPVHRNQRSIPSTGVIVATSIVDTGLDIQPAPALLVDSGLSLAKILRSVSATPVVGPALPVVSPLLVRSQFYNSVTTWTAPSRDRQRRGRVGRVSDGHVITHEKAGSGVVPEFFLPPTAWLDTDPEMMKLLAGFIPGAYLFDELFSHLDAPYCYLRVFPSRSPRFAVPPQVARVAYLWTVHCEGFDSAVSRATLGDIHGDEYGLKLLDSLDDAEKRLVLSALNPGVIERVALSAMGSLTRGRLLAWDVLNQCMVYL